MKQLKMLTLTILTTLFTSNVFAETIVPVIVACYGDNGSFSMSFYDTDIAVTYQSEINEVVFNFESWAQTPFAIAHSSVTNTVQPNYYKLEAQVIGGDSITPIIETSALIELTRDASGSFILTTADVYHLSVKQDLQQFVGHSCYVQ